MSATKDEQIQEAIIDRASDWYMRHRDGALSAAEKEEFLCWLRASLQHAGEYLAVARLAGGLRAAIADLSWDEQSLQDQLADNHEKDKVIHPSRFSRPAAPGSTATRRRVLPLLAASVIAACGVYWFMPPGFIGLPRSISANRDEQRTVQLQDGSLLHMNTSSKVRVRYSRNERLIELDRGEALFKVARDRNRPFRVRAGKAEIVAVGTQFDVHRHSSDNVTVTVVQGKVDVIERGAADSLVTEERSTTLVDPIRLGAGQRVEFGARQIVREAQPADVRAATAWVRREIVFDGKPLREVTEEFNRYLPVPIEIDDRSLRELKVSGIFNAYDSESFIVFLHQYDVDVREQDDAIYVRRRKHE